MKLTLFGREITIGKKKALSPPNGRWQTIFDHFPGAWQMDVELDQQTIGASWAVFSCATTIAADISKCPPVVMRQAGKIWEKTLNRPVLRKPNGYQTQIEFLFCWAISKLLNGNTYILKERDDRGFVGAMHVLDPLKVKPLISDDGRVFYELNSDNLSKVYQSQIIVPASEIIHDKMYTLYHPLIGVSPLYAAGRAAAQGLAIQNNSKQFFENMSRPSGMLTAPGKIGDETANRLKVAFETNFSGSNIGKMFVAGDDLKYSTFSVNAEDSQLIEQLKMTAEMVCACFHVPGYKIGVGPMPTVNNTAILNQQYYDQCLQFPIESMEHRLDEGLELPEGEQVWFDLSNLLRMDPEARYKSHNEAIKGGWLAPNEARVQENMPPVEGGDSPMVQQQNYSLAAIARRDEREMDPPKQEDPESMELALDGIIHKHLGNTKWIN